jgi:toxin-antitoxin system PIN domain toxin
MIAIDTNVLIHAHRAEMPFHARARALIESLAQGTDRWALPWPCAHEFIAVLTRPGVFKTPSTVEAVFGVLRALAALPHCDFLAEGEGHLDTLHELARVGHVVGPAIHDARIAAICIRHGVRELWSADRDFSRFPQIKVRNPLIA